MTPKSHAFLDVDFFRYREISRCSNNLSRSCRRRPRRALAKIDMGRKSGKRLFRRIFIEKRSGDATQSNECPQLTVSCETKPQRIICEAAKIDVRDVHVVQAMWFVLSQNALQSSVMTTVSPKKMRTTVMASSRTFFSWQWEPASRRACAEVFWTLHGLPRSQPEHGQFQPET